MNSKTPPTAPDDSHVSLELPIETTEPNMGLLLTGPFQSHPSTCGLLLLRAEKG